MNKILEVKDLRISFRTANGKVQAVRDISFDLFERETLAIVGDAWPLEHRQVLGRAVRVRNPYVDALSRAQVRALRVVRAQQEELAEEEKAELLALILSTVTGVSAGLQNTG